MVKRKKNGALTLDEDKRNDDGSSPAFLEMSASVITECNESSAASTSVKNRVHVTRTATKEIQNTSENIDSDPSAQAFDKTQKVIPGQRISNRVPKRLKKETNIIHIALKKSVVSLKPDVPLRSKTRRPWELWSVEDKNSFFEALCEYGKDFESIQSYIAQRSKKKGTPMNMIKNKDQVRHFYYRTWHKISKHLVIGDEVRKQTQEIYGLINYAELRKKIGGCLNEKNRQKLNELVFNGVTTVKYKGKKLRIKTPVCRALKKLNNVSESKEPEVEKLPKDIAVELRPQSNHAWLLVQNLAQNPRVRTKIPLQRRLKSVIEYLQNKWKPYRIKKKEQILSNMTQPDSSFPDDDLIPVLHLRPHKDSLIANLTISAMDSASSSDVCLEKHLKTSKEQTSDKETAKKKTPRFKLKPQNENDVKNDKCSESEVPDASTKECEHILEDSYNINLLTPPKSVEEMEDLNENIVDQAQRTLLLLSSMTNPIVDSEPDAHEVSDCAEFPLEKTDDRQMTGSFNCTTIEEIYLNTCQEGELLTLGQILGRNSNIESVLPEPENPVADNVEVDLSKENEEKSLAGFVDDSDGKLNIVDSSVKSENYSWNLKNVGLMTIGELYLMLGRPSKIILEYEFEFHNEDKAKEVKANDDGSPVNTCNQLGDVMRRLMHVAASTFLEFKNRQIPVSQTYRNLSSSRTNSTTQSSSKTSSRCTTKNTTVKTTVKTTKLLKIGSDVSSLSGQPEDYANKTDICSTTNSLNTICSEGVSSSDNHVFVMPVGPAPRMVKKPTQESLKEEMDKLLPSTRRGCRVRRKPLVVQRPLLPRDGIGTMGGPRPMTLVHLVPSGSQLAAVIPSIDKTNVLPSKKVMKILSAGPAIDVRPLQVPIIPQPKSLAATRLVVNPVTQAAAAVDHHNVTTMNKRPVIIASATGAALPNMPDASSLSSPITVQSLPTSSEAISLQDELISSPPQISIPDTSSSSSDTISPFIRISMAERVPSESLPETSESNMLNFPANSEFALQSSKSVAVEPLPENLPSSENTPPQSPPSRPFRINSPGPEAQWLNGESSEFSLNTLLNTLESPSKVLSVSSSSMNLANENSNSDPITRLAPVVDSQVRCLLEECSVDFITKFEDLADVINSSNNDSKTT